MNIFATRYPLISILSVYVDSFSRVLLVSHDAHTGGGNLPDFDRRSLPKQTNTRLVAVQIFI